TKLWISKPPPRYEWAGIQETMENPRNNGKSTKIWMSKPPPRYEWAGIQDSPQNILKNQRQSLETSRDCLFIVLYFLQKWEFY
ncbi:MAG TPA: hypothetical protein PLH45_05290, partial [Synergistales bacterium]|nr:hypothetical protein [Synergistales bacterium]